MKIDVTSIITIIKCAIGAGSFTLPYAFQRGGLWISFILTLLLGYLSAYTLKLLIICERTVSINVRDYKVQQETNNVLNQYTVLNENENSAANDNDNDNGNSIAAVNENESSAPTTTTTTNDNSNNENKQLTYSDIGSYIYPGLYLNYNYNHYNYRYYYQIFLLRYFFVK